MLFKLQNGKNIPLGQTFRFTSPFSLLNNTNPLNVNYNNLYNEWKNTHDKNYQMGFTGDSWDKENELLKKLSFITLDKHPLLLKLRPNLDRIPEISKEFENNAKDAYIKYGIRESPEANNIKEYFSSYASSPGYQRIRENQKNWWVQRHPYRKLYVNPEKVLTTTDEIKDKLSNIKTKVFDLNLPADTGVNYVGNTILLGTMDDNVYPYDFVMAHELAHTANWSGLNSTKQSAQGEALDQNTSVEKNKHDELRSEKHSDKEGLMWLLYKENIYDSRGTKDCTPEDIAKLRKLYPYLRPLQQMTDEEASWMINHVADKGTNYDMTNFAKRGGVIKGKQGLIYTPFISNSHESNDNLYDWTDNQWYFPVEPVRISNPTPIQETTSKPEETVKESSIVETPITEEPVIGKIYTSKEKEQFKSDMYNAYFSELSSRGLDDNLADAFAKRLTTQDILESGWGQSSLSKYFNFGGIKDFRSNSNPVVLTTHEYENGERKTKKQPFRRFDNLSEYVKYKIDLVSKNWKVFDDIPEMYFENLVKGRLKYATSPTYADKLDRLFKSIWKTT